MAIAFGDSGEAEGAPAREHMCYDRWERGVDGAGGVCFWGRATVGGERGSRGECVDELLVVSGARASIADGPGEVISEDAGYGEYSSGGSDSRVLRAVVSV